MRGKIVCASQVNEMNAKSPTESFYRNAIKICACVVAISMSVRRPMEVSSANRCDDKFGQRREIGDRGPQCDEHVHAAGHGAYDCLFHVYGPAMCPNEKGDKLVGNTP